MDVVAPGGKFNLTDIHATIGLHQLPRSTASRGAAPSSPMLYFAAARSAGLEALGIELPPPTDSAAATTNWHMFQVVLPAERLKGGRAAVMEAMHAAGIGTGVHYPAIHLFSFYRSLGWREGMLPVAERIGRGILTLPLFPAMTRRRRRARLRAPRRGLPRARCRERRRSISVVIPVYNEEAVLPALFDRLYPVLDAIGEPLRDHLHQRRQRRPLGGAARRAVRASGPT